jgi:hypothetical protein
MPMTPRLRKLALTAHVTASVGWLGAVAVFLALAVAGVISPDPWTVRAAYVAMELTAWFVIVPLAFAALLTGLVSSLGTTWGLFRHYWVLAKLLLTAVATVVLLIKLDPIGHMADVAAETTLANTDLRETRISLLAHAAGGLFVLLIVTVLGVYKPRGLTAYGRRKEPGSESTSVTPTWVKVAGILVMALILLRIILHLHGHGPHHH